jgi:sensor domain CHASE-containing protein
MTDDAPRPMAPRYGPTWLLVGVAALVMLAVGAAFIRLVERYHAETSRKAARNLATTLVHRVEMRLVRSLSALDALAVSVRQGGSAQSIDAVATAIVGAGGGIGALALAPNAVVAQVYPPGAAGPLLGRELLADPATQPATAEAVQARQPVLASTRLTPREPWVILGHQPVWARTAVGLRRAPARPR